ncbi:MAG: Dam family site-specific DNA-(adenine-N6)-methyltransferase [Myxococcales bacterium]|nr:Dam family site-specific DNA-(adenine-N6)-methyltransferase [Myxococcales bacterium]
MSSPNVRSSQPIPQFASTRALPPLRVLDGGGPATNRVTGPVPRAGLHIVPQPVAEPAQPFLKWVGGKRRLLDQLVPLLPTGRLRYAEPFLGGGAMFFRLWSLGRLESALLTDASADVVNACNVLRDDVDALVGRLRAHAHAYLPADADARAAYFYAVRDRHPSLVPMDAVERAARMVFLNRTCFNGLWRENRRGLFNAPHGRYDAPTLCPEDRLRAAARALDAATVARADFRSLPNLCRAHGVTFAYLDPPYHPVSVTSAFNAYSGGAFAATAQAELADTCRALDRAGVRWMLSNSDCDFVRGLYRGFDIRTVQAARAVNCKGDRRGTVAEVVVRNY